jgi:DNA-binding transcriptional LysR family regulator
MALMPSMLIEAELARGELIAACDRPLRGERSYYLAMPAKRDERPALRLFRAWLLAQAGAPREPGSSAAHAPSRPAPPSRST